MVNNNISILDFFFSSWPTPRPLVQIQMKRFEFLLNGNHFEIIRKTIHLMLLGRRVREREKKKNNNTNNMNWNWIGILVFGIYNWNQCWNWFAIVFNMLFISPNKLAASVLVETATKKEEKKKITKATFEKLFNLTQRIIFQFRYTNRSAIPQLKSFSFS